MTAFLALPLAIALGPLPRLEAIDAVRLVRGRGETAYRLTLQAKGSAPWVQTVHSYDPPNVYLVNLGNQGPAALLHGFDPQADFLTVFTRQGGRWHKSETVYARYGIVLRHGRQGELSIEARIPRELPKGTAQAGKWDVIRYRIDHGNLVEAESQKER